MAFTTRPGGLFKGKEKYGWVVAIDQNGEIALNLSLNNLTQDVHCEASGSLLYSQPAVGLITEVDQNGNQLAQWHARGRWLDKSPPQGSIELPLYVLHHTTQTFPNGNFLLLSAESRIINDWYTSTIDPASRRKRANVVGDLIVEVSRSGEVVRELHLFDVLDPYRITHGSLNDNWVKKGLPDTYDWCHANSAVYDPTDDSVVISLRHQDCIIKVGWRDGQLRWILGNPSHWRKPQREKLLQSHGELTWPSHQHDCSIVQPNRILCFDNGNFRAAAFEPTRPDVENFSRAVEFEIDERNMQVVQVWSYGQQFGNELFSCYNSGVVRLPKTGNTFITFGGLCTKDGEPTSDNEKGFCRARLMEVTPNNEIVFDMTVDGSHWEHPVPFSVFRSEHVPEIFSG